MRSRAKNRHASDDLRDETWGRNHTSLSSYRAPKISENARTKMARALSDLLASYILVSVVLVYSYSLYPLSTLSLSTID